mmetsp:Transcript_9471/g.14528  ORF Transcript_9471/g.14528 Transcript_9471/m.14528 type:complete len:91 (+) Transcript_9471:2472-2744(+)
MDQTCIDTDDDDFELDGADREEKEDVLQNDVSAFMVSRSNISRFRAKNDQSRVIPNKLLDTDIMNSGHQSDKDRLSSVKSRDYKPPSTFK